MQFDKGVATKVHNGKYDYSKVDYQGADIKIEIICPVHGSFFQKSYLHILHKNGCPKCKGEKIYNAKKKTLEFFICKARKIHGEKYDYPLQQFKNAFSKINIVCKMHGKFKQTFSNHIYNSNGCPSCGKGKNISAAEKEWLQSLNILHLEYQKRLHGKKKYYKVDAFDPITNTVYEYFGVFWHGHPDYFPKGINPKTKKPYKYHYRKALEKVKDLEAVGYSVVSKWG